MQHVYQKVLSRDSLTSRRRKLTFFRKIFVTYTCHPWLIKTIVMRDRPSSRYAHAKVFSNPVRKLLSVKLQWNCDTAGIWLSKMIPEKSWVFFWRPLEENSLAYWFMIPFFGWIWVMETYFLCESYPMYDKTILNTALQFHLSMSSFQYQFYKVVLVKIMISVKIPVGHQLSR